MIMPCIKSMSAGEVFGMIPDVSAGSVLLGAPGAPGSTTVPCCAKAGAAATADASTNAREPPNQRLQEAFSRDIGVDNTLSCGPRTREDARRRYTDPTPSSPRYTPWQPPSSEPPQIAWMAL